MALAAGLLLAGCAAVGPEYVRPQVAPPLTWHADMAQGLQSAAPARQALAEWWKALHDPVLTSLVQRAVADNFDLKQARGRLREARARRELAGAQLYPTLQGSGSATRSRSGQETGSGTTRELYSAGFDASWEPDVFGGQRRGLEAARADLQASEEDLRDVTVSLLAEVALNYVDLRSYQTRLGIARANLKTLNETNDLARWRAQAGLTGELDVEQAKSNLEQTRANVPALKTGMEQAANRLAVLVGQPPGTVTAELAQPGPIPVPPPQVAVGVPADTLRQRPDVRRAERRLAAQTARIGEAEASRYPSLSLLGSIGLDALSPGKLLGIQALTSSLAAKAAATLFDAGRIQQNIAIQTALQAQALGAYRAAVLQALQDVEDALVAYANTQTRLQSLRSAAASAQTAAKLAADQYASGLIDFQTVLDTQRTSLSLTDQVAVANGDATANLVRLYKALGGGWSPRPETTAGLASRAEPEGSRR